MGRVAKDKSTRGRATPPVDLPPLATPSPSGGSETRVPPPTPDETPKKERHGGARPGAGRPKGSRTRAKKDPDEDRVAKRAQWRAEGADLVQEWELEGHFKFLSEFIALRWGELWRFTPKEVGDLSLRTAIVVVKHIPDAAKDYAEEIGLVGSIFGIIGVRVLQVWLEFQARNATEVAAEPVPDKPAETADTDADTGAKSHEHFAALARPKVV